MPAEGIQKFREQYPQYNDLSDDQILQGMYRKYYSDLPQEEYFKRFEAKYGALRESPGFGKAVAERLTPTTTAKYMNPALTAGEIALKSLMLPANVLAGLLPTRSGEMAGKEETVAEGIARGKFPSEALSPEELQGIGRAFRTATGQYQAALPEQEQALGALAMDIVVDPLWIPGIKLGKGFIGLIRKGLTKEAANLAAKELGLAAKQADDYVKFWTAPENQAKLDAAEVMVNREGFEAQKIGKSELEALKEQITQRAAKEEATSQAGIDVSERQAAIEQQLVEQEQIARSAKSAVDLNKSLKIKEQLARLVNQIEKAKRTQISPIEIFTNPANQKLLDDAEIAANRLQFETQRVGLSPQGAIKRQLADDIIADLEKIPEEMRESARPKVTKRVRYVVGQEQTAKEAAKIKPVSRIVSKIKSGKATGQEIKAAAKTAPQETEAALRQEFQAATTPEEKVNIAQGIDIVTQEAGKKPKVPVATGAQKVRTAISRDPDLHLQNSEIEAIYGAGTEESKKLIKQIGGGKKTLDDVSLQLQEAGTIPPAPEGYNSQHLINLISEDAPTVATAEQQLARKAEEVYGPTTKKLPEIKERPTPPKPKAETEKLTYDELNVGDEFTINGEKFTVSGKTTDNSGKTFGVKLKDRKNYEQDFSDFENGVEFDAGSLKKAGEAPKAEPTPLEQVAKGKKEGMGFDEYLNEHGGEILEEMEKRGKDVTVVSIKYNNPSPAGPFVGKNVELPGKLSKGDVVNAPFGEATVTSVKQHGKRPGRVSFEDVKEEALRRYKTTPAKPLKEGESIPLQRGEKEFAEQQAKEGRKVRKVTSQQRKEKFAKKLEEGKYKGDMFVEAEKGKQAGLPLTGKEFGKGLIDAVKKDIRGEQLGVVADPYRNLREFLDKNKLALSAEERKKLIDFAQKTVKSAFIGAREKEKLINEYIAKNLTKKEATQAAKQQPASATFEQLEKKWQQPMGEKPSQTLGYNVEKMHPALKDELPQIIENFRDEFNLMRGEQLTTQQAIDSAMDFAGNLTDEAVMGLQRGDVTNASHLLGARIYVNNRLLEIGDKLLKLPKDASGKLIGELTAENKHVLDMYMKVRSLGTETARALRFMQIPVGDNLVNGLKNYQNALKKIDPKSAKVLGEIITDAEKMPTKTDAILFWWYNSMLSNPFTDLANITGNASHLAWEMIANLANKPSSIKGMLKALPQGWRQGLKQARAIYMQEEDLISKFASSEGMRGRYDVYPKTKLGRFGRGLLPTTRLGIEDAIFSNIAKEMRIGIEAPKIARKTGLSTDEVLQNIRRVIDDPKFKPGENDKIFREIAQYADKYAEYVTFRTPLKSQFGRGLQNTIWVKPFVPFARVMANISKAGFKNSPAGLIKLFGKDAKLLTLAERQDIVRRAMAGSLIFAGLGAMMADGKIEVTGAGPDNKKSRELWDKMGYKPNHLYVVNSDGSKTGISYQNINPFNVVLAVMGNWQDQYRFGSKLTDDEKTFSEKLSYALGGAASTMTDQSFMQGISNLFDWIKYKNESYLEDFVTKPFIPNIVGFPRNIREYVTGEKPRFEARNWWERVKRRVGLYEGLIPTQSAYGGQKESGYERFPYFPSQIRRDALLEDLRAKNALVSVPSKKTTINNRVMTDEEYAVYVQRSGDLIIRELRSNQEKILTQDAEETQKYVDDIVRRLREKVKTEIAKRGKVRQLRRSERLLRRIP